MLSSGVLDVAVGLLLLYGLISAAASTLVELVASMLAWRANDLHAAIRVMLGSPKVWTLGSRLRWLFCGGGFSRAPSEAAPADAVLDHGLMGGALPTKRDRPSYVSAQNFTLALFDVLTGSAPVSLQAIADALERPDAMPERVRRALQPLVHSAATLEEARGNVEHWFDSQMARLSGLYKRRTQAWLVAFGLGVAAIFNLDTFEIARKLATDAAAGAAVVAAAQAHSIAPGRAPGDVHAPITGPPGTVASGATVALSVVENQDDIERTRAEYARFIEEVRDMTSTGFSVGWKGPVCRPDDATASCGWSWVSKAFGILITALSTVVGASTWFSGLGRILALRSSVKPEPKRT